jgi:hypothetical protein
MFALFNKQKKFIGYSADIPDIESILKVKISDEHTDFTKWKWHGEYDTGRMVSLSENPIVFEEIDLKASLFSKIKKEYPLDVQNVIMIKQIKKLCDYFDSNMKNDDFKEMSDTLLKAVELHEKDTKFYIEKNENA